MTIKTRAEWAPFGSIDSYPLGSGRVFISATCHICEKWWRRRTAKGARRTLHRHWSTIQTTQSDEGQADA